MNLTAQDEAPAKWQRFIPSLFRPLLAPALNSPKVWIGLGWSDVVQSYRRTVLGPLWITLNLAIIATAMTVVYGALFGVPTSEYSSYVVCGMIAWLWVSALLSEVGNTFITYGSFIKSMPIDKTVFVWATVFKQLVTLAHHLVVYAVLVAIGMIQLSFYTLYAIPALIVLTLFSVPFTAIASIVFARYRDVPRLIGGSIIIVLMITPIFWQPKMITGWRQALVYLNPLHYLIEFVRQPLLGLPIESQTVFVVLGMTAVVWLIGAIVYRRYNRYVVFWI